MNNHRAPLDNQRTPAAPSGGLRPAPRHVVGSPALSAGRLRQPSDTRSGGLGGESRHQGASPSMIPGRSPKAPTSPDARRSSREVQSDMSLEVQPAGDFGRGGILEENNMQINVNNRPEEQLPLAPLIKFFR